jgi:two-component system sensor histidine kinase KdpD
MTIKKHSGLHYVVGVLIPIFCTLLNFALEPITGRATFLMMYLFGVFLVASRWGYGVSIVASVFSALLFDFYFTTPVFSFWIANIEDLIALIIMISVGTITSQLLNQAKNAHIAKAKAEDEALRNSLLSAISHDLRTPLTRIIGVATTLMESYDHISKAEIQEFSHVIFDESQRMSELMNKILDMAKLSTGQISIHREWNTLEEILGSALKRLEKELVRRPVNTHLSENLPLIWVDSVLFEQVIVNLIENAIKYTPSSSPIDIEADFSIQYLTISISDYGIGIPQSLEHKIFDKFFRLEHETEQNGVGLGLSLCRSIMELHAGTIQVKQVPHKGAVFVINLPMVQSPAMLLDESI